ncbi:MAG: tRNA lysidine(34) synthetase TilS [Qingshengfaniella sp.]
MTPAERCAASLTASLTAQFGADPPGRIGVAVSGGGDSVALLVLLADWARQQGVALAVATVDHRLRPEAAAEAAAVSRLAATLGLAHDRLIWNGWDGRGNLQAAARRARYRLLSDWAAAQGIAHVCLGHTRDDQAETVLLRLARGSGVDGLGGMAADRREGPVTWLRPLLECRRGALRDLLATRGIGWADDPSNDDPTYDRVRARRLLADPSLPGLDVETLAATAGRMQAAARVLRQVARQAAETLVHEEGGDLLFAASPLLALEDDTRWRLLAGAVGWVSGQIYRPRLSALRGAEMALRAGKAATVQGALLRVRRGMVRVGREPAATGPAVAVPGPWDGRWQVEALAPVPTGLRIGRLTETALAHFGRSETGLPHQTLMASPAVYDGDRPIAAPLAHPIPGWRVRLLRDQADFLKRVMSD